MREANRPVISINVANTSVANMGRLALAGGLV